MVFSLEGDRKEAQNKRERAQTLDVLRVQVFCYLMSVLFQHKTVARDSEDIGRVDGGFINSRLSAFGAALVTPVLLEFGALKWLLERLLVG